MPPLGLCPQCNSENTASPIMFTVIWSVVVIIPQLTGFIVAFYDGSISEVVSLE